MDLIFHQTAQTRKCIQFHLSSGLCKVKTTINNFLLLDRAKAIVQIVCNISTILIDIMHNSIIQNLIFRCQGAILKY